MRVPTTKSASPPPPSLLLLLILLIHLCAGPLAPIAALHLPSSTPSVTSRPCRGATNPSRPSSSGTRTTTRTRRRRRTTTIVLLDRYDEGGETMDSSMTTPPRRATDRRSLSSSGKGPRRRRSSTSSTTTTTTTSSSSSSSPPPMTRRRAPHQFDHQEADARPFLDDPASLVRDSSTNEDAPPYALPLPDDDDRLPPVVVGDTHVTSMGLDDLFPGLDFSESFCSDGAFRTALRDAIREDVFDSSPGYAAMSEKARRMLLLPDSSLQGSWRRRSPPTGPDDDVRMRRLTAVLRRNLGDAAPTGDEFMEGVGGVCGSGSTGHWIDIVGIVGRRISHSWHQDTGKCQGGDTRTVLLGFPREDDYDGAGVFSHAVKLERERHAPVGHPPSEPIVYPMLTVDDKFVVRPRFAKGREILAFRDVDILHSAPDVAYRTSVMRFM